MARSMTLVHTFTSWEPLAVALLSSCSSLMTCKLYICEHLLTQQTMCSAGIWPPPRRLLNPVQQHWVAQIT